jgi:flavoprotein
MLYVCLPNTNNSVLGAACGPADSCYVPNPLNATATRGQGSVPFYAVHVTMPEHIVSYVKFALKHNLRSTLTVRMIVLSH